MQACPTCGIELDNPRSNQIYCSKQCRDTMWKRKHRIAPAQASDPADTVPSGIEPCKDAQTDGHDHDGDGSYPSLLRMCITRLSHAVNDEGTAVRDLPPLVRRLLECSRELEELQATPETDTTEATDTADDFDPGTI